MFNCREIANIKKAVWIPPRNSNVEAVVQDPIIYGGDRLELPLTLFHGLSFSVRNRSESILFLPIFREN